MHKSMLSGMNTSGLGRWEGVIYMLGSYGMAVVWIRLMCLGGGAWLCDGSRLAVTFGFCGDTISLLSMRSWIS